MSWETRSTAGWTAPGSGGPLDEELQLADSGTADVEHSPAGSQQDRGGDQDEPEVHGVGSGIGEILRTGAQRSRQRGRIERF